MPIIGPRSRLVYFRLSDKEFEELNSLCTGDEGARSVSQISRAAVQALLSRRADRENDLKQAITAVNDRISKLDDRLEQMAQLIVREHAMPVPKDSDE